MLNLWVLEVLHVLLEFGDIVQMVLEHIGVSAAETCPVACRRN